MSPLPVSYLYDRKVCFWPDFADRHEPVHVTIVAQHDLESRLLPSTVIHISLPDQLTVAPDLAHPVKRHHVGLAILFLDVK